MTRLARAILMLTSAIVCASAALVASARADERGAFPHAQHEGLFPTCTPCHAGASNAGAPIYSVGPEDCARCHDGGATASVAWSPPIRPAALTIFDHATHVTNATIECAQCHQALGAGGRMAVAIPDAQRCLECHGTASAHLEEPSCAPCHRPLTAIAGLSAERITAFRAPPNHASKTFLFEHGPLSERDPLRCSICHARETCESCHLNAALLEPIQSLAPDPRVLAQARRIDARWPRPASHDDSAWMAEHGAQRESLARCGNCHARESCEACHRDQAEAIAALPEETATGPKGARMARARPPNHHPWFATEHAAVALMGSNCATCHDAPSFCEGCHDPGGIASSTTAQVIGPAGSATFHPPNFVERHSAEAYGRDSDCAGCHSNETFCRSCHASSGLAAFDSRTSAYHDAQPFWLINHGAAARQGLESCASCHQQTDCLQCHSDKSGWRINPHGPDFDPGALGDGNLAPCAQCHYADPRQ